MSDRFTTCVPLVIPGVVEREAWRDADELWLAAVMAEVMRGAEPDTRELDGGRVETTIELLRTGEFVHRSQGRFSVTGRVLDEIVANFAADAHKSDHPHAVFVTIGHPQGGLDGVPAAGWITDVWRLGDSVFGRVSLNPKTVEMLREGEFKYFSPDFHVKGWTDEAGRIVGAKLHSGAITNFPFIRGMAPFQLSATLDEPGVEDMTLTPEQVSKLVADQVAALGATLKTDLAKDVGSAVKAQLADATKDLSKQLADAVKAAGPKSDTPADADLKQLSATVSRLDGDLAKAVADNKRLSDALGATSEALEARDITDLVNQGLAAGKLTAGEVPGVGTKDWDARKWLQDDGRFAGVNGLRQHIAKAPVAVKLSDSRGALTGVPADQPKHSAVDDAEAKRLGFKDAADFDRHLQLADAAD